MPTPSSPSATPSPLAGWTRDLLERRALELMRDHERAGVAYERLRSVLKLHSYASASGEFESANPGASAWALEVVERLADELGDALHLPAEGRHAGA